MKNRKHILIVGLAWMVAACSSENEEPLSGTSLTLHATIDEAITRSSGISSFSADDQIGVYMGSDYQNIKFSTSDGSNFKPVDNVMYITRKEQTVEAYYPYNRSYYVDTSPMREQTKDLDILYAKGSANSLTGTAELTFKHLMTKIQINVSLGAGYKDEVGTDESKAQDVKLSGFITFGLFTPPCNIELTAYTETLEVGDLSFDEEQELLMFPQTMETFTIKLHYDDKLFTSKLKNVIWEPGHKYNYSCRVEKEALVVTTEEIDNWQEGNSATDTPMNYVSQTN